MSQVKNPIMIGVDTGGTFTDVVVSQHGKLSHFKVPSNPEDPAFPVIEAVRRIIDLGEDARIIHGTTVATNAVLERKGGNVALLTTAGFEDLLVIGRQARSELYNLCGRESAPLIRRERCFGISERIDIHGKVLIRPQLKDLTRLKSKLERYKIKVVAICFLHSYANPINETFVAEFLEKNGFKVTLSCEVLPEYREYERCSTVALNGFLLPVMNRYYKQLEDDLHVKNLRIMQSSGGSISSKAARERPVQTVLSGPAGGAVAAKELGSLAGFDNLITLDMGGTSTDVSVIAKSLPLTSEGVIDGLPIKVPMIDIETVGAGGGSIAWIDAGGALRVGPQSAGANPGPVCYGSGKELTVTDAHLFLGNIPAHAALGGIVKPDLQRTIRYFETSAAVFNLSPIELAEGILKVAEANMERALRVVSVQRGHDPRDFYLFAFGGAGGLHACRLADSLRMKGVIVPNRAGVISAFGMLLTDLVRDYSKTVLMHGMDINFEDVNQEYQILSDLATKDLMAEGIPEDQIYLERSLSMRYVGQSFELKVAFGKNLVEQFHQTHLQRYSYADRNREVEVVNLILRASGITKKPKLEPVEALSHQPGGNDVAIINNGKQLGATLYARTDLKPGAVFSGPALIHSLDSTILIPDQWHCKVDSWENLIIKRGNHD